ncbi:WG repeat-containing protein [Larkinella soli]|uniref:WG repeat-containing protein n=1 Tax=Larkinella soli TaxID=1770527 RepID=UPI000FFBD0B0|nr:WG repeat-containing protein [Larkinella soli]
MKLIYLLAAVGAVWAVRYLWLKLRDQAADSNPQLLQEVQNLPPNALYPAGGKEKWGYINSRKEWIIKPVFFAAGDFFEGRAVVQKLTVEPEYARTYALIDTTGRVVADGYDRMLDFSDGLAAVARNEKWGFIDREGKEVIPLQYEDAASFSEGLACVKLGGKNGFIDKAGKMVIAPQFSRSCTASVFSEGLASVYTTYDDGPSGYIDHSGRFVIPPDFSFVQPFHEGLAMVRPLDSPYIGFIDAKGRWVIKPDRYEDGHTMYEGIASVARLSADRRQWHWSLIDRSGKTIAELPYRFVGIFREGLAGVQGEDRGWGFIDRTGREVVKPTYTGVSLYRHGLARMETGSLFGGLKTVYITKTGKVFWKGE